MVVPGNLLRRASPRLSWWQGIGLFAVGGATGQVLERRRAASLVVVPPPPRSLFFQPPPARAAEALHHVALFTVDPRYDDRETRRERAEELCRRLLALAALPEIQALRAHTGDVGNGADVLLSVEYGEAFDLDRVRQEPRHQAMLDWYLEHFDESARHEITYWGPALRPVVAG